MNIKKVVSCLDKIIEFANRVAGAKSGEGLYPYWIGDKLLNSATVLKQEEFEYAEEIKAIADKVEPLINRKHNFTITADRLKPYVSELLEYSLKKVEEFRPYIYKDIIIGDQYYKAKTVLYNEDSSYDNTIRYIVATFYSEQEMKAMLANLQKGNKSNRIDGDYYLNAKAVKNGYRCIYVRTKNENIGDGVHAIIYHEDERVLKVQKNENPIDKVYKFLTTSIKTGLIPEWKEYFYNTLSDKGLISECKGYDYTGKAPKVLVLSDDITDDLILSLKQEGLRNGLISLSVEKNVEFKQDATFFELVTEYVIPYIQDEEVHYKVGDPIDKIISSNINLGNGKTGKLYPRQQVIAQGMLNAFRSGKTRQILNGDMGLGKTLVSGKLALAIVNEIHNSFNGRVGLTCQGILLNKWKREFQQAARPLGVEPKFIEINNFSDVRKFSAKPKGFEVFLLSKDKVKRSYQVEMAANERFNRTALVSVGNFSKELETSSAIIIANAKNLPISRMRYATSKAEGMYNKPVILYKEQLDTDGSIIGYKVTTSSNLIKSAYKTSTKAYDFFINQSSWDRFIKEVTNETEKLTLETENKSRRSHIHRNGLTCPTCGGFIYQKDSHLFDEEKFDENLQVAPKNKSKSLSKCNHYIKADGTPLMNFEIEGIRNGDIGVSSVDETETVVYTDSDGNSLEGKDLYNAKSGYCDFGYSINVKKCGGDLWTAMDKKGYRVVDSAEMIKKHFGKGFFDVLIADEAHQYNGLSTQGFTYATLVQVSKSVINLTGTLTGGKASDIFYMLYRLYPGKMKAMGYDFNNVGLFIDHYGRRERVTKEYFDTKYNKSGKGSTSSVMTERPGISPLLYTNFLSGVMVSRSIEDMNLPMPELSYYKHDVEMDDELKEGYEDLKKQLITFMNDNKELPLGGSFIHSLLAYPDNPQQEPIFWNNTDILVANPRYIDLKGRLLPKEKKLVDTIKKEIAQDRNVLVYSMYSGLKGVSSRLMEVFNQEGIKAVELKSSIPVEKREEWIEQKAKEGYRVLLTNPVNVQTGLNIIAYPTIYAYESGYDIKVIRQSERRAWRVNQPKKCKIIYGYYRNSLQEDALKLIGSKKKASLAIEGVFSEDLLSSMGDVGDSGAKALFDVLKGKISLKENDLDAFGFAEDDEIVVNESDDIFITAESHSDIVTFDDKDGQIKIVFDTIKEDDNIGKDAKKYNISEGQLVLFAM